MWDKPDGVVKTTSRRACRLLMSGGDQNFLGARWVGAAVRVAPERHREKFVLWLLSLSPHYFSSPDRVAEAQRNRDSRARLTESLLAPYLSPGMLVIDYGCGPGYMAAAVAERVRAVEAVDISHGVLACASVLNPSPKTVYETPDECALRSEPADFAYSIAVAQHLTDATLTRVLALLHQRLRPGGMLAMHFSVVDDAWRSEEEWRRDKSLTGRWNLKRRLNCFGRDTEAMERMLTDAGFEGIAIEALANKITDDDDVAQQHWATCTRR